LGCSIGGLLGEVLVSFVERLTTRSNEHGMCNESRILGLHHFLGSCDHDRTTRASGGSFLLWSGSSGHADIDDHSVGHNSCSRRVPDL